MEYYYAHKKGNVHAIPNTIPTEKKLSFLNAGRDIYFQFKSYLKSCFLQQLTKF